MKKTAEDYLEEAYKKIKEMQSNLHSDVDPVLLKAMHAYAAQQNEWVSVEDDCPKARQKVLAINKFGYMRQADWEVGCDQNREWFKNSFTHWQPLPTPPTK